MLYSHSSGARYNTKASGFTQSNNNSEHTTDVHKKFIRNIRHFQPNAQKLLTRSLARLVRYKAIADVTFVVCGAWIMLFVRSYFWMVRMFHIALVFI